MIVNVGQSKPLSSSSPRSESNNRLHNSSYILVVCYVHLIRTISLDYCLFKHYSLFSKATNQCKIQFKSAMQFYIQILNSQWNNSPQNSSYTNMLVVCYMYLIQTIFLNYCLLNINPSSAKQHIKLKFCSKVRCNFTFEQKFLM